MTTLRILILFGLQLLQPLVLTFSASTCWRWFIERDLGPGPSHAAWYGIMSIVGLLFMVSLTYAGLLEVDKREESNETWTKWRTVGRSSVIIFAALISLPMMWVTGHVLGYL